MAQKTVGVLVAAALPWGMRIAEVDVDAGVDADASVNVPVPCLGPRSGSGAASSGKALIVAIIASATVSGSRRAGRCRSCTNPVERSTRVPIWECLVFARGSRSPSQCPGTARSAASAGRSLILTMPGDAATPARQDANALPWLAQGAPGPQTCGQLATQFPASLHVERLIDGFVGHLHLRAIGIGRGQHPGDLLRAVLLDQPRLHLVAQRRAATQLAGLGPARSLLTTPLSNTRRIA